MLLSALPFETRLRPSTSSGLQPLLRMSGLVAIDACSISITAQMAAQLDAEQPPVGTWEQPPEPEPD